MRRPALVALAIGIFTVAGFGAVEENLAQTTADGAADGSGDVAAVEVVAEGGDAGSTDGHDAADADLDESQAGEGDAEVDATDSAAEGDGAETDVSVDAADENVDASADAD